MKISTKLLLIIVVSTALMGVAALSGVLASADLLENQIKEKYMAVSTYAIEKVHRLFSRRYDDIVKLARDPVIISRDSTPRRIAEKLREYKRHFDSYIPYASISFFDLEGRRIASAGRAGSGARRAGPGYLARMEEGRGFVLETPGTGSSKSNMFHLAHLVRSAGGDPSGFVAANIPAESFQKIIERPLGLFKIDGPFNVNLIDGRGRILFSTDDKPGILGTISPLFGVVRNARAASGVAGTVFPADPSGKKDRRIVVFAREAKDAGLPRSDWTLIISLPERAALAPVTTLKNRLVLVFIAIGGIALGMVLMLSRTITRPLARLSRAITEVGKGNLEAVVKVSSSDEIGRLSAVFNGMVGELRELHGQLRDAASVDGLTGAFNRKRIEEILRQEADRARRYGSPLSMVLFDLDHFKDINDTHGHLSGDYILKTVIGIVQDNIRRTDLLGRWGGEEFMLLTPGTGLEQAAELADKIRRRIESFPFASVGAVTISCGVAAFLEGDACPDLIKRADDALYSAKDKGRNAVEVLR